MPPEFISLAKKLNLTTSPTGQQQSFQLKVLPSEMVPTGNAEEPDQGSRPSNSAPRPPFAASEGLKDFSRQEPELKILRNGETITAIQVLCGCGQAHEVTFDYTQS